MAKQKKPSNFWLNVLIYLRKVKSPSLFLDNWILKINNINKQ